MIGKQQLLMALWLARLSDAVQQRHGVQERPRYGRVRGRRGDDELREVLDEYLLAVDEPLLRLQQVQQQQPGQRGELVAGGGRGRGGGLLLLLGLGVLLVAAHDALADAVGALGALAVAAEVRARAVHARVDDHHPLPFLGRAGFVLAHELKNKNNG